MTYPESLIRCIADRHGLSGSLSLMPKGGMVNEAWAIGENHVLRIVAEGMDAECDDEAPREAAVVPILTAYGITTPRLIAADMEFGPRPYTIYERAYGELLGFSAKSYADYEDAWRQLGEELAVLHSIRATDELRPALRTDGGPDYEKWIKRALDRGAIDQTTADDVWETATRLSKIGGSPPEPCLIHNDVHPWNLMGDPSTGELTAILDWGDATLGDPARDFAMMPLQCVPSMLDAYSSSLQTLGQEGSMRIVARAFVVGLSVALFELSTPEMYDYDRKWWRMPPGGWEEMRLLIGELWPDLS